MFYAHISLHNIYLYNFKNDLMNFIIPILFRLLSILGNSKIEYEKVHP